MKDRDGIIGMKEIEFFSALDTNGLKLSYDYIGSRSTMTTRPDLYTKHALELENACVWNPRNSGGMEQVSIRGSVRIQSLSQDMDTFFSLGGKS